MKKLKLTFFSDAQHGWLAVKRSMLKELGIDSKITSFSYQKGNTVYLEEDADVSTFVKAMELKYDAKWEELKTVVLDIKNSYSERSAIRGYASYTINKVEEFKKGLKIRLYGKEYVVSYVMEKQVNVRTMDGMKEYKLKPSQFDDCSLVLDN